MLKFFTPPRGGLSGAYIEFDSPVAVEGEDTRLDAQSQTPFTRHRWDGGLVITLNDTYLELANNRSLTRGMFVSLGLIVVGMVLPFFISMVMDFWGKPWGFYGAFAFAFVFCILSLIVWFFYCAIGETREAFALTHYPTRFNRKTRQVHFFTDRGEVVTHDWDKLYFSLDPGYRGNTVLNAVAEDGKQATGVKPLIGGHGDEAHDFWEFLRSYMNNGAETVVDDVTYYLPIAEKKESYALGFYLVTWSADMMGRTGFFGYLPNFVFSIGRFLTGWTMRVPKWPAEIEAVCQIAPDDPFIARQAQAPQFSWRWIWAANDPKWIKKQANRARHDAAAQARWEEAGRRK